MPPYEIILTTYYILHVFLSCFDIILKIRTIYSQENFFYQIKLISLKNNWRGFIFETASRVVFEAFFLNYSKRKIKSN